MQKVIVEVEVTVNTLEDVEAKDVGEALQELLEDFDGGVATVISTRNK